MGSDYSMDNKIMMGMQQLYSKDFAKAKPVDEDAAAIQSEEEIQKQEVFSKENEKQQVAPSELKNIVSQKGEFNSIEQLALKESNPSQDGVLSVDTKQRLLNYLGNSNNKQGTVEKENAVKTDLFKTLGTDNTKSDKFSELGQVLDIEQQLCSSLPQEAQEVVKELQGVRSNFVSSLMEQAVSQWGSDFGKFENLPENIQQQFFGYIANFTSNIIQLMLDSNAQDNLKQA